MKAKIILLFALILGITQGVNAQENEEKSNTTGFFGVIVSVNPYYEYGGGFELGFIPNKVGFGFQAEYSPSPQPHMESSTFLRGFLLFKVTETFFIKSPVGVEARNLDFRGEFQNEVSFNFGVGPHFMFKNFYLGLQFNVSNSPVNGLNFSTGSGLIGLKFK